MSSRPLLGNFARIETMNLGSRRCKRILGAPRPCGTSGPLITKEGADRATWRARPSYSTATTTMSSLRSVRPSDVTGRSRKGLPREIERSSSRARRAFPSPEEGVLLQLYFAHTESRNLVFAIQSGTVQTHHHVSCKSGNEPFSKE